MTDHRVVAAAEMMDADAFWLRYLRAHDHPVTRCIHYIGVGTGALLVVASVMTASWTLFWLGQLTGYAITLVSHLVRGRSSAIWGVDGQPLRSVLCCYRMSFCALIGVIDSELRRAQVIAPPLK